ncbi:protein mms22 [Favolaschia claudopus]|uniref:Protein mms22 n=1 Tax=Favolaschia claudopus TaxID=2862362 RepID=A0AAW0BYJ9_9AGAR
MDDYVETSDPEELEDLRRLRPPVIRPPSRNSRHSPRKRPKLHHEYSDTMPRTPIRSPSYSSHEAPSPQFRSTSPASLTSGSSRRASSLVVTPPVSDVRQHSVTLSPDNSQEDPLLLKPSRASHVASPHVRTPSSSPLFSQSDFADPPSPVKAAPSHPSTPAQSRDSRSPSADPVLLFTPPQHSLGGGADTEDEENQVSLPAVDSPPSPLTPSHSERSLSPDGDASPRPPPTSNKPDAGAEFVRSIAGGRQLRDRQEHQKKPYQADKRRYRMLMKGLPEAIVPAERSPKRRRGHDRYEEDEDVQTQELQDAEYESESEGKRTKRARKRSKDRSPSNDWIQVPSLPSDDDEDGSIAATRKEAHKMQEKQKRERKEKHRRKKAKAFPLQPSDDPDREQHASRRSPLPRSNVRMGSPEPQTPHRSRTSSPLELRPSSPKSPSPLASPTHSAQNTRSISPPDFIRHDSDVDMDMPNTFSPPPDSPSAQIGDHQSPIVISENESDDPNPTQQDEAPEELTAAEKKHRARLRALSRMYPAFMRDQMMKGGELSKPKRRPQPASSSSESEEDQEQPLLPGQTRARIADRPRDLHEIKGDTESSEDEQATVESRKMADSDDEPPFIDSDVQVVWPGRKSRAQEFIWDSDEEDGCDGRIDDERIEAYLREAPVRGSGLQEKDMIDWMLDNTAFIGGARQRTTQAKVAKTTQSSRGSKKPKISITVGGARRERQTKLPFVKTSKRRQGGDRRRTQSPPRSAASDRRPRAPVHQTVLIIERTRSRSPRHRSPSMSPERNEMYDDERSPSTPRRTSALRESVPRVQDPADMRKAQRKQRDKERKEFIKMQGIWINIAAQGSRIVGQPCKASSSAKVLSKAVSIVPDRGFHEALAPIKSHKARVHRGPSGSKSVSTRIESAPRSAVKQRKPRPKKVHRPGRPPSPVSMDDEPEQHGSEGPEEAAVQSSAQDEDVDEDPEPNSYSDTEQHFLLDFGIPVAFRITFSMQTYIGNFQLKQLIDPPAQTVRPGYYSAQGFDLGPNISTQEFPDILDNICARFLEYATGLPQPDSQEQDREWSKIASIVCQLLSFLPADEALKTAVQTRVLWLTSKMREADMTPASMDASTFSICWFAVELAVRAGFTLPESRPRPKDSVNPLKEACGVLVEYLMKYGLEKGMEPLGSEATIDGSTLPHRAFEMWLGLWYIGLKYRHPASTNPVHPLWGLVQTTLQARPVHAKSPLEASEQAWRVIFTLSALSQICASECMTRYVSAPPAPPACWDMVVYALQQIDLEANDEIDQTMSESALDHRDRYIRCVVERCCLLWSRWQWGLQETSPVISQLIKVFQSRKFTNLRNEATEFPDFLRLNDWTLLSRPIHTETTFVLFLKLVYQTLLVSPSKSTKFLSLLAPVGHLPWSKAHPPSLRELSQLYNRFSIFAIGIAVNPKGHAQWIQRARKYVLFKDVDATARTAYIRGLMYLSIVMIQRDVPLDESVSWLEEMVTVLLDEYKHQSGSKNVIVGIHALVVAARNIIRSYKGIDPPRYPDPRLLLSLERILRDSSLVKANNASAHIVPRLIRSFLAVRTLAVPEPRFPTIVMEPESQDEYAALAFDDDLIAALDQEDKPEYLVKDGSLCKLLDENIYWLLYRQLVEYVRINKLSKSFKKNDRISVDIASLTECWLGCGSIVIQNGKKSWSEFLGPYTRSSWPILDAFGQRRMDFLVYSNILKLDPMSYLTLKETFLVVFFEAVISWHTTTEDSYISLLLCVDGLQHPLLRGVPWDADAQKELTSNVDILNGRLPLITAILENLSVCLDESEPCEEDNAKYIGYCIKMFSAMKNVHSELAKSKAAQQSYTNWCSKIVKACQSRPIIEGEDRLRQWMDWGAGLSVV